MWRTVVGTTHTSSPLRRIQKLNAANLSDCTVLNAENGGSRFASLDLIPERVEYLKPCVRNRYSALCSKSFNAGEARRELLVGAVERQRGVDPRFPREVD